MKFNLPLPCLSGPLALLYLHGKDKAVQMGKNIYTQWSENKCHVSIKFPFKCFPEDTSCSIEKQEESPPRSELDVQNENMLVLLTQHFNALNILIMPVSKSKFPFIIILVTSIAQRSAVYFFADPNQFIYLLRKVKCYIFFLFLFSVRNWGVWKRVDIHNLLFLAKTEK